MKQETELKLKYGVWGVIAGAAGAMLIGFNWGGWSTQSASKALTHAAVLTTRSAICVAQFIRPPNDQKRLKELQAVNSWERPAFIEKGGWDKMPGEQAADDAVARACADELGVLMEKS